MREKPTRPDPYRRVPSDPVGGWIEALLVGAGVGGFVALAVAIVGTAIWGS